MIEIFKFLSKVIITFILTNIQDVVILINFFLEATEPDSLIKNQHVVLGQYLGFSTLLSLSLIGFTISYILPVKLFGFLGFLIIFFGLNGLYQLYKNLLKQKRTKQNKGKPKDIDENIVNEDNNFIEDDVQQTTKEIKQTCCDHFRQIIKVSLVTIANGNDNIAIYVPIFVQSKTWEIIVYSLGFLFMVGVLCLTCYCFIHFPPIFKFAQKYAQYISPFIFIALGIYILIESKCFPWLIKVIKTGKWTYE